jgi:two-component system phosphate regulon sensor histidine kinase PhoR
MGLYIAAEIVKAHDGTIGVESDGSNGSAFYFDLPLLGHEGPR